MNDDTPGQEPAASTPPVPPPAASTSATPLNEPPGSPYVVLEKLARDLLDEQRMNRRWRVFFRFSALILAFIAVWAAFDFKGTTKQVNSRHTALIEIDGEIDSASSTGSVSSILPALNDAFSDIASVGLILKMNSPGGSPVQSAIINDEINRLRKLHPEKPVYVVIEDMCASGCYYIAAAADKIYVSQASIVGSIGVLMSSFGFTGLMEKLGVERRLMTAGENKGIMDPFSPYSAKHKEFTQAMLKEIHEQFIAAVRKGRGKRLKENPEIFSGLFWTGSRAITLGLADGLGTVDTVARDVLKAEDVIDYTVREGLSDRVLKKFGAAIGEGAARVVSNDWMKPR
ncbi:MAG: S49 family peptidase [bacterium]|jgi:protease-4